MRTDTVLSCLFLVHLTEDVSEQIHWSQDYSGY